ncbi:MAG TPA: GspMb/PilO family protein [Burkholderiales bacterium]|nr:GspMb/PilO family protein [Burkholderiales bacterium]
MKRLLDHIGLAGVAAIALLAAALAFSNFVLTPLEDRGARLQDHLSRKAPAAAQPGADKVAAVYEFLQKDEDTTDWLAKLHGIGVATGVQLKSASYRTQKTDARIVRTEIVLPVAGSYTQIRDFLKRSLAEIPVLSLDSISIKRGERAIQAEMRLTLHMVKS